MSETGENPSNEGGKEERALASQDTLKGLLDGVREKLPGPLTYTGEDGKAYQRAQRGIFETPDSRFLMVYHARGSGPVATIISRGIGETNFSPRERWNIYEDPLSENPLSVTKLTNFKFPPDVSDKDPEVGDVFALGLPDEDMPLDPTEYPAMLSEGNVAPKAIYDDELGGIITAIAAAEKVQGNSYF